MEIRLFEKNDLNSYLSICMDEDNYRFLFAFPPQSVFEAKDRFKNYILDGNKYAIIVNDTIVGYLNVTPYPYHKKASLGYFIGAKYQNMGYASKGLKLLVNLLIDKGYEKLEATCYEGNLASRRVLEKNGFILEGTIRKEFYIKGHYANICHYGLIREDLKCD